MGTDGQKQSVIGSSEPPSNGRFDRQRRRHHLWLRQVSNLSNGLSWPKKHLEDYPANIVLCASAENTE
jgi:hypothetical protein